MCFVSCCLHTSTERRAQDEVQVFPKLSRFGKDPKNGDVTIRAVLCSQFIFAPYHKSIKQ